MEIARSNTHPILGKSGILVLFCLILTATATAQTQMKEQDGQFNFLTNGLPIHINDTSTNQDIIRFQEGGDVQIPNGDLSFGTNRGISSIDEIQADEHGGPSDATYTYSSDQGTGVYSSATSNVGLSTGGVSALNVTSSQNVDIPNGNLNMSFNTVTDFNALQYQSGNGIEIGDATTTADLPSTVAIGRGASATDSFGFGEAIAIGSQAVAELGGTAVGDETDASGNPSDSQSLSVALGAYARANGADGASALGYQADSWGAWSTAVGAYANTTEYGGVAVGHANDVYGYGSVGIGTITGTEQDYSLAAGWNATSESFWSTSLGAFASASSNYSTTLGYSAGYGASEGIGAVAIGHDATAPNSYEATFGNLQGERLDVNVTGNATVHGRLAVGNNSLSGLVPGDINVSSIYYDYSVAKSPVVQCSQGSDWCHVTVPEQQDSFYVKKGDSFDKDRPRATAAEVVNASAVDTWQELQAVKAENRRQDRQIKQLTAALCRDQPNASVCR